MWHDISIFGKKLVDRGLVESRFGHKSIIVFSHGTFSIGKTLEEAYFVTEQTEHSCKLKYYYDLARKQH